jgi:gamma-tubulin complex component 5
MQAQLDSDKIKPADRVTFLLNYLYLSLKNSQVLESTASMELAMLRDLFLATLDPYIHILSQWLSHGELNDPYGEFFIKVNPQLKPNVHSREQWLRSFIFRTINLNEFEDHFLGNDNKMQAVKLEVSIPIFLRDQIKDILSVGKSIKIIRLAGKETENQ